MLAACFYRNQKFQNFRPHICCSLCEREAAGAADALVRSKTLGLECVACGFFDVASDFFFFAGSVLEQCNIMW